MWQRSAFLIPLLVLSGGASPQGRLPVAAPNDNRTPAGMLQDGVLSITLDARLAQWYPDGDSLPGMSIEAFGEAGKPPSAPGPLLRVPAGTELRLNIRNSLQRDTITFYLPATLATGVPGITFDSVVVAPRESRELRTRAVRPGNYVYRANARSALDRALRMRGFLSGALVVDSAGRPARQDRVFVLHSTVDALTEIGVPDTRREILAINGRSWPHTERIEATVGDTLNWRVINAAPGVHPMHLHGFYFRVDAFDGPTPLMPSQQVAGRMAATERMTPFTTMSMTWIPERAGNWLFHCHYQPHATPHRALGETRPTSAAGHAAHANHAFTAMGGLVMAIQVKPRGTEVENEPRATRQLRLVAVRDPEFAEPMPSMRFRLEERSTGRVTAARPGFSPSIELKRGEPVAIAVVNQLSEPTAVHWHGIELESYYDGVAGFAGNNRRVAPLILPGDSFIARFTPPRSGTFIYHSHVDEPRQHRAGLGGALIIRDTSSDAMPEQLFFIKSARASSAEGAMEINGQVNPDTVVLRTGTRYRFRLIGLPVTSPNTTVYLTARRDSSYANLRDTMLVRWRPLAKDGADLPEPQRTLRPAVQPVSIGETYDFEFQPLQRGELRLELRPPSLGRLTVRVPIRVE